MWRKKGGISIGGEARRSRRATVGDVGSAFDAYPGTFSSTSLFPYVWVVMFGADPIDPRNGGAHVSIVRGDARDEIMKFYDVVLCGGIPGGIRVSTQESKEVHW